MKNIKLLTTLFLFTLSPIVSAEFSTSEEKEVVVGLKPFFTDGCTLFVDGPQNRPKLWRHCCVEHDLRYWFGGSVEDRDATDLRLKACVEKVAGANWASIIYYGVKTGHVSPIKNKTQWNWGWIDKREFGPLSSEEVRTVKLALSYMKVPEVDMLDFLKVNFP